MKFKQRPKNPYLTDTDRTANGCGWFVTAVFVIGVSLFALFIIYTFIVLAVTYGI